MKRALHAGCTGKRKRTEYVPIAAFSDRELVSDYNFLEEAALLRDSSTRDTQRMLQSQKLLQLRQLQTSVSTFLHCSQEAAKEASGTKVAKGGDTDKEYSTSHMQRML